jgi:DNA-binding LacI/PurR family transcriptional regulator
MPVTQDDVAREAGVSRALVSLVMRNSSQVSEARRAAVLAAADALGYRPNVHASQLASHRSMIIGLVITELENPLFAQVMFASERAAAQRGYDLLPTLGDLTVDRERQAVDRLLAHRVDGVILTGTHLTAAEIAALSQELPVAVSGRVVVDVDSVSTDDRAGATMLVEHLVELGHRRIAHIDGGSNAGADGRRAGYVTAMTAHGLKAHVTVAEGGALERDGIAAAHRLLDSAHPPTAVLAFNDTVALGVLAVARRRGLRVPEDLSVAGFDDTPVSGLDYVNLTTVHQSRTRHGDDAVRLVVERIAVPDRPPRSVLVPPRLVLRGTTGTAKT